MSVVHLCHDDGSSQSLWFGAQMFFRFIARAHAWRGGGHLGDAFQVSDGSC